MQWLVPWLTSLLHASVVPGVARLFSSSLEAWPRLPGASSSLSSALPDAFDFFLLEPATENEVEVAVDDEVEPSLRSARRRGARS